MMKKIFITLSISLSSFGKITPNVIYGNDDRKEPFEELDKTLVSFASSTLAVIPDSNISVVGGRLKITGKTFKEYAKLCSNEKFGDQLSGADCSAFLVSPTMIATAGHCVENMICGDQWYVFDFGLYQNGSRYFDLPESNGYRCKSIVKKVYTSNEDFALIELDRPVTDREPLKVRESGTLSSVDELVMIGHPVGIPTKIAAGGHLRAHFSGYFTANLDAYGGNSGSLVMNKFTGLVEGILVRGATDFVWNSVKKCNVSNKCADNGCSGESVTKAEIFKNYIR